jgi:hypothetical protein
VHEALVTDRLKRKGQKSKPNDMLDEYVAFYAPYCAVAALDGPTFTRARDAKVPCATRITKDLSEVSRILDRVISGELRPEPFSS